MQYTACRPGQTEIMKVLQSSLLIASTAVSLNGKSEIITMQFTAWRPADRFFNGNTDSFTMQYTACRPAQPIL
jgi:hypothetical protein